MPNAQCPTPHVSHLTSHVARRPVADDVYAMDEKDARRGAAHPLGTSVVIIFLMAFLVGVIVFSVGFVVFKRCVATPSARRTAAAFSRVASCVIGAAVAPRTVFSLAASCAVFTLESSSLSDKWASCC